MTCSTNPLFGMQPLFNQTILSDTQLQDEIAKTFLYTGAGTLNQGASRLQQNVMAQQRSDLTIMSKITADHQIGETVDCDPIPLTGKHQLEFDDYPSKAAKKQRVEPALPKSSSIAAFGHAHADDPCIPASSEGISTFADADVLSGRGGGTNVHPGNRTFRDLINTHRREYLKAKKNDKPAISRAIVKIIRDTGGRFLKKDGKSNMWVEIGDTLAREKTSQALRQRAPEMRRLMFQNEQEEARSSMNTQGQLQQMLLNGMGRNMLQNNFNNFYRTGASDAGLNLLSGLQSNLGSVADPSFGLRVSQMHKKLHAEATAGAIDQTALPSHLYKEL
ncbi:unnamed protein product [Cylindrotheca closterium]|uniref:DUF6824 domain-containing protein n=1 Tax=Cylindrotheca closterium TaxID=2856 RepID=A0AAD2CGY5_9STRA|nr:unnamed protein product [Cylindrotheca closterium]